MRSRAHYWSCTKFADFIRGTSKPKAATAEGWNNWRDIAKAAHPIRHWIAEEFLDAVQNTLWWPIDIVYDAKYWLVNRFVTKTHSLTSTLKRGQYHELDTRILHCLFDELVNYVEVEQAWFNIAWDKEARERHKAAWNAVGWFRFRTWRCPAAGIESLTWAAALKNDDDTPTQQAHTASEVLALYHWWKEVYPNRPDAYDVSGWTEHVAARSAQGSWWLGSSSDTPEEREHALKLMNDGHAIEAVYEQEDEAMLIRLIKIRKGLWT